MQKLLIPAARHYVPGDWRKIRETTVAARTARFLYLFPPPRPTIAARVSLRGKLGLSNRSAQYSRRITGRQAPPAQLREQVIDDTHGMYARVGGRGPWEYIEDPDDTDGVVVRDGDVFGMLDLLLGVISTGPGQPAQRTRQAMSAHLLEVSLLLVTANTGPGPDPAIAPPGIEQIRIRAYLDAMQRLAGIDCFQPWLWQSTRPPTSSFWLWDFGGPKPVVAPRNSVRLDAL